MTFVKNTLKRDRERFDTIYDLRGFRDRLGAKLDQSSQ